MKSSFRANVVVKQAETGTAIHDTRFSGMRTLAAAVIKHAIIDYNDATYALREANKHPFLYNREDFVRFRRAILETRGFLTDNTLWHQVLGIDPDYFKRLLHENKLPMITYRNEATK